MRDPLLRPFSGRDAAGESPSTDSWLNRVRENLGQLLIPSHLKPSAANGAPIHLLKLDKSVRPARAQGASLITHGAIFAALLFLLARGPGNKPPAIANDGMPPGPLNFPMPVFRSLRNEHPSDGSGKSGGQNPIPATHGNLPPLSAIVIVRPSLPQREDSQLPVPPTIFDANAPPVLAPTEKMGLPWMQKDTNSPGPGKKDGIGSKDGVSLGDGGPGVGGEWTGNAPYAPGVTAPGCAYCPIPTYTDEARHGKVQGSVTLQVLVGADGRAQSIRIVKGIGFGLDERAVETVRGWKFTPARDGARRALAAWITVEAVFRLF